MKNINTTRHNLVRDKYNIGEGLAYIASYVKTITYDYFAQKEVLCLKKVGGIRAYWGNIKPKQRSGARKAAKIRKLAKNYLGGVPSYYKCKECNVYGVKLWRPYMYIEPLYCANCAEVNQQKSHKENWKSTFKIGIGDQIGWFIPAVPDENKNMWGYTSVPEYACIWWDKLPLNMV